MSAFNAGGLVGLGLAVRLALSVSLPLLPV